MRNGPDTTSIRGVPIGSYVMVYRERGATDTSQWTDPFVVFDISESSATVLGQSGPQTFRMSHVKRFFEPSTSQPNPKDTTTLQGTTKLQPTDNQRKDTSSTAATTVPQQKNHMTLSCKIRMNNIFTLFVLLLHTQLQRILPCLLLQTLHILSQTPFQIPSQLHYQHHFHSSLNHSTSIPSIIFRWLPTRTLSHRHRPPLLYPTHRCPTAMVRA